ncbi:O-antigen ligase family protein [Poriferisphaera corsica]|uniref:O-antigen ligase family protein n=1 Tax=Poriferisphaera corsica TaxID=2528020 RepID=UPI0019092CB1|nr:O-antigen ligase family protein [Poriferisphaera corsica]
MQNQPQPTIEQATPRLPIIASASLLITALLPAVAPFYASLYLDTLPDPNTPLITIPAFGPSAIVFLNLIAIIIAVFSIPLANRSGAKSFPLLNVFILIPIACLLYHATQSYDNALLASSWIAALTTALATLYLAQFQQVQKIIIAAFAALLIPYLLDSIWYLFVEQPLTVRTFIENEQAELLARGWEAGSTQHQLFLRRMQSPDALGSFGLSNVFGSILVTIILITTTLTLHALAQSNRKLARIIPLAIITLAGLFTLYYTHSKGALGVLPLGFLLLIAFFITSKKPFKSSKYLLTCLALAIVLFPFLLVIARGLLGAPETHEGERSLLFRYQYWLGSWNIYTDSITNILLGTGPDNFRFQYLIHKLPANPEDVISAHSIFIDYIATLGLAGILLTIAALSLIIKSIINFTQVLNTPEESQTSNPFTPRITLALATFIAALTLGLQFYITQPEQYADTAILWLISLIAFIATFFIITHALAIPTRIQSIALITAAVVILAHSQIEMTFFQFTSAPIAWLIITAAFASTIKPSKASRPKSNTRIALITTILLAITAIATFTLITRPINQYQTLLVNAESALHQRSYSRALDLLDKAAAEQPTANTAQKSRILVRSNIVLLYTQRNNKPSAIKYLNQAINNAQNYIIHAPGGAAPYRYLIQLYELANRENLLPNALNDSLHPATEAVNRSPYSLPDYLKLADIQYQLGDRTEAQNIYRHILSLNDQLYLDPGKQLTSNQLELVNSRLQFTPLEQ